MNGVRKEIKSSSLIMIKLDNPGINSERNQLVNFSVTKLLKHKESNITNANITTSSVKIAISKFIEKINSEYVGDFKAEKTDNLVSKIICIINRLSGDEMKSEIWDVIKYIGADFEQQLRKILLGNVLDKHPTYIRQELITIATDYIKLLDDQISSTSLVFFDTSASIRKLIAEVFEYVKSMREYVQPRIFINDLKQTILGPFLFEDITKDSIDSHILLEKRVVVTMKVREKISSLVLMPTLEKSINEQHLVDIIMRNIIEYSLLFSSKNLKPYEFLPPLYKIVKGTIYKWEISHNADKIMSFFYRFRSPRNANPTWRYGGKKIAMKMWEFNRNNGFFESLGYVKGVALTIESRKIKCTLQKINEKWNGGSISLPCYIIPARGDRCMVKHGIVTTIDDVRVKIPQYLSRDFNEIFMQINVKGVCCCLDGWLCHSLEKNNDFYNGAVKYYIMDIIFITDDPAVISAAFMKRYSFISKIISNLKCANKITLVNMSPSFHLKDNIHPNVVVDEIFRKHNEYIKSDYEGSLIINDLYPIDLPSIYSQYKYCYREGKFLAQEKTGIISRVLPHNGATLEIKFGDYSFRIVPNITFEKRKLLFENGSRYVGKELKFTHQGYYSNGPRMIKILSDFN